MRSLWRTLALQWLGGEGSEALTADSVILDMVFGEDVRTMHAFDVQRAAVSHHAILSASADQRPDAEAALDEALHSEFPRR
jgi:hypothetical protein